MPPPLYLHRGSCSLVFVWRLHRVKGAPVAAAHTGGPWPYRFSVVCVQVLEHRLLVIKKLLQRDPQQGELLKVNR